MTIKQQIRASAGIHQEIREEVCDTVETEVYSKTPVTDAYDFSRPMREAIDASLYWVVNTYVYQVTERYKL